MPGKSEEVAVVKPEVNDVNGSSMLCPMCGSAVPQEAVECPSCGEPFSPEAFEGKDPKSKKSKFLFISGVLLVLIGGPGIALGSWLHDILYISILNYDNFDSFGWANKLVSTVGIIILVIGIILLILSLPRGRSNRKVKDNNSTTPEEKG